MRLSDFITANKEPILQAWEDFARTIDTPLEAMDADGLRDHASQMLDTITADLARPQTPREQHLKSRGLAKRRADDTYAEIHAAARLISGYTINQLVSEYRALRASVLKYWARASPESMLTDLDDMTRFNEAIDEALAESVARFSDMVGEAASVSQRRLETVLDAVPVGIALADDVGALTMTNTETARIWGVESAAALSEEFPRRKGWWADRSDRHGLPVRPDEWPAALALHGSPSVGTVIEIEPFGQPGVRRTILMHATPFLDGTDKVIGAVVAHVDITGQVRAENALSESEAKFKTIANAMPQMVWSTLPDGFHDYFNEQWYEFTGVPRGATDGEGWNDLFHADDRERAWDAWRQCLRSGASYEIQYRLRHHSGHYRWVLGRALPVRDEDGVITRWMGTCTDMHDQKLAEKRLQDDNERKDEFLAMLAHELRNPLAPISSAAHILGLVSHDPKRVEQAGATIERQVRHMTNLVDDLLDVSRVTRGLVALVKEEIDFKVILASAIEQVRPLIDARGHELSVRQAPGAIIVAGDRTRLVQVIANLLNNAAKYTARHGKIVVAVQCDELSVSLAVADNGAGIAPTLLPHIFDLFTQGERTPDRVQGGLGLGLALVKSLTELHGGTISVRSGGPGEGTTFTLLLPILRAGEQTARSPLAPDASLKERRALRVVVVDDNVDAAQALGTLLEVVGHVVTVYDSALALLDDPGGAYADAFILDIGLPGMDGHELARRLRIDSRTSASLIIALTGYGQAQDKMLTEAAGFDYHFVKPVNFSELDNALARIQPKPGP